MRTGLVGVIFCLMHAALLASAQATDYTWQESGGVDGGAFDDSNHWSPTGFPSGPSDNATIDLLGMGAYSVFLPDNNQSVRALTLDSTNLTFDNSSFQFTTAGDTDVKHGQVIWAHNLWRNNGGAITQTITIEAPAFFTADTNATVRENYVNNGTTNVDGSFFLDSGSTTTTNNSTFSVMTGASLKVTGTFDQAGGTLSIANADAANFTGAIFNFTGGSVGGTALMASSTLNIGAGAGSGSFDAQSSNTLTGNVLIGQVITDNSTDANGVAMLSWKTSGFSNAGQIVMTSAGSAAHNTFLSVATGNTLVSSGEIDFNAGVGGTRFLTADAVNNSGTINVNAPTDMSGGGSALANTGHIHIAPSSSLTLSAFVGNFTQTSGETQDDGTLASKMVQIQGGNLHGVGSISGALQVSASGQVAPGNGSIGTLSVSGNTSFSGGSLAEYLGAVGSPGTSDLLAITGNLNLSGATGLDLSGGTNGGFYTIATYTGSLTGTFSSVTPGYTVDYSHAGQIRVDASFVPGDVNHDGVVNGLDISLISSHWLQTGAGASGAAVPEPATIVLAAIGAVLGSLGALRRMKTRTPRITQIIPCSDGTEVGRDGTRR